MIFLSVPVTPADHSQGAEDAPLTLVEYGDYECSHCGRAEASLRAARERYGDDLRIVFRNFPLVEIHPHALAASLAAEAAAMQGRFWEMHDQLFAHQDDLDEDALVEHARSLGLDLDRLVSDSNSNECLERVEKDIAGGIDSDVGGTPTFFINGERHEGGYDAATLIADLERHLNGTIA